MQIESVTFKNFKVLRDTTLPLSRMTLLIGPNGSGKSTAFEGLRLLRQHVTGALGSDGFEFLTLGSSSSPDARAVLSVNWGAPASGWRSRLTLSLSGTVQHEAPPKSRANASKLLNETLLGIRVYSLEAPALKGSVELRPTAELSVKGHGLAVVLDRLRDTAPERFERLNAELPRWFPEYDRVLFDTPGAGSRALALRLASGIGVIPADGMSEGTLLALALLTLAHLPSPPSIVCIEEPDRGVHPRLLRNIHEALTRLAYPEASGDTRPPVQVIATTHSPYFLDLFKDHPEEVVIAERQNGDATFRRLVDLPNIKEILEDAPLGEVWFTGILGGVPVGR